MYIGVRIYMLKTYECITDPPQTAPMIFICREMDITYESFVVQWDAVNDIFPVNYFVSWYRGNELIGIASVNGLSYTATGLTANTSYNVTVVAINSCCGTGPYSSVIIVTTNSKLPTFPPTVTTITITRAATTTATPTLGNVTCDQTWVQIHCIVFKYNYKCYKIFKYKYNCNYFGQDGN